MKVEKMVEKMVVWRVETTVPKRVARMVGMKVDWMVAR